MKKVILIVLAVIVVFLGYGAYVNSTPEGKAKSKDRQAIDYCWSTQKKKSNTPEQARFIAGACEKMENDFRAKYGVNP